MLWVLPGQPNVIEFTMLGRATGDPIIDGDVQFYLVAKDGDNVGKWYKGSNGTWADSEEEAGSAAHKADGHWTLSLPTEVWVLGVAYLAYAKESEDAHIPVDKDIVCGLLAEWAPGALEITVDCGGATAGGCQWWLTTSAEDSQTGLVRSGVANSLGLFTTNVDAGTYYLWRELTGVNFDNPQTLVVSEE